MSPVGPVTRLAGYQGEFCDQFNIYGEIQDASGSPERARYLHLARSGSQSQRRICFILPAHGASHIIREISAPSTGNKLKKQTKMVEHKLVFVHSCNFTDKGIIRIPLSLLRRRS